MLVVVGVEVRAELHEEIDDLVDRHIERGSGLHAGPDEIVEIERRGEEAAVDRAFVLGGRGDGPPLDEVRNGQCHRRGFERTHAMLPRTKASIVPAHVNLSSPPSRSV